MKIFPYEIAHIRWDRVFFMVGEPGAGETIQKKFFEKGEPFT